MRGSSFIAFTETSGAFAITESFHILVSAASGSWTIVTTYIITWTVVGVAIIAVIVVVVVSTITIVTIPVPVPVAIMVTVVVSIPIGTTPVSTVTISIITPSVVVRAIVPVVIVPVRTIPGVSPPPVISHVDAGTPAPGVIIVPVEICIVVTIVTER